MGVSPAAGHAVAPATAGRSPERPFHAYEDAPLDCPSGGGWTATPRPKPSFPLVTYLERLRSQQRTEVTTPAEREAARSFVLERAFACVGCGRFAFARPDVVCYWCARRAGMGGTRGAVPDGTFTLT